MGCEQGSGVNEERGQWYHCVNERWGVQSVDVFGAQQGVLQLVCWGPSAAPHGAVRVPPLVHPSVL